MADAKPSNPTKSSPATNQGKPTVEETFDTSKNKPTNRVVKIKEGMTRIDR